RLAVGVPAPAVLQPELFFVDPVECAVDRRARAVARQLRDFTAGDVLDVDVVLAVAHPPHTAAVGRKLGEHQRRGLTVAAQLLEGPPGEIEHPVVAAGVADQHARRLLGARSRREYSSIASGVESPAGTSRAAGTR